MDMNMIKLGLFCLSAAAVVGCATFPDQPTTQKLAEKMVAEAYPGIPETLTRRTLQDQSQKICSKINDAKLTGQEAAEIVRLARESVKYPASGKLVGDWRVGEKLAYNGAGTRIRSGRVEKVKENGALCSNCHVLDPREVNAGNVGPSLAAFGAQRGNSEATVKYAYEKIYNAWAYFPCSNMPRLGHEGFLTPEQITHVVAYLVDPQSPVNKK
jgi:sulfur-oxidizing protein SoxX